MLTRTDGLNAMAFIPANDVWACVIRFTGTGVRPKTIGFHVVDGLGDDSTTRASLLCSEIAGWLAADYSEHYGAGLIASNIEARSLNSASGTVYNLGTNIPGTNVSAGLPANVAFAISFRTGRAGRSYRGRIFHPWLGETEVTGNLLLISRADAMVASWEALDAQLAALDFYMSVVSFYTGGAARSAGEATRISNYLYTDLSVDTQRRRVRPL